MRASVSIGGHPLHPLSVALPIGVWVFSFIADLIYLWRGNPAWQTVAFYCLAGGCVFAALSAVSGLIDLIGIKDTPAFRTALLHAGCVVTALVIFAASFYLRTLGGAQMIGSGSNIPVFISLLGVVVLMVGGWLGGEMVFKHGVGVDTRPDGN